MRRGVEAVTAGWLFADMLLVLALVALGGQPSPRSTGPQRIDSAGRKGAPTTPAPSSTPSPTRTSRPGIDPHSVSFDVHGDALALRDGGTRAAAAGRSLRGEVGKAVRGYRNEGRYAAFVIVWGTAADCSGCAVNDSASRDYADDVAQLLPGAAPGFFPAYDPKIIRGYRDTSGGRRAGTATVEMFFLRT